MLMVMRTTTSTYPNRKHTPETLRAELERAHRAGSTGEVADLLVLLANAERPVGAKPQEGVAKARNRQAARRYGRERTHDQHAGNPTRSVIRVGDYVRLPDGKITIVTRIQADILWSELPEQPIVNCPIKLVTRVDAPAPAPVEARAPVGEAIGEAAETLYHACWDAVEAQDWPGVERALRAYEERLV